ncbi:MAG: hypothetical protein WC943_05155 [Elusimicrobiota bacterium]|jgi:hypothetical protein
MRSPLYLVLFSLLFASLNAGAAPGSQGQTQPAKTGGGKGGFSVKYIGEPGSSHAQPTGSAAGFIETASRQDGGQGTFGPIGSDGKPAAAPIEPARDAVASPAPASASPPPAYRPAARAPAQRRDFTANPASGKSASAAKAGAGAPASGQAGTAATAAAKEAAEAEDGSLYSLWDGTPLSLPSNVPDPEAASAPKAGGEASQPALAAQVPEARKPFLVEPFSVPGAEGKVGELFVRFELDLAKARPAPSSPAASADAAPVPPAAAPAAAQPAALAELLASDPEAVQQDALAELGRVAGFRQDPRFDDTMRDAVADRVSVRGWIPSDRIAAAMRVPGVAMLEIEPRTARPSYGTQAATDILIGIRVPRGRGGAPADTGAGSVYAGILGRLGSETGFDLKRTIGYQEVPGGKDAVIVVSGSIPVRNISKALGLNGVVKIASSPDAGAPAQAGAAERRGFLSFVFSRSPLLVAATLLVLLSPLSLGLFRFLQVLNPYRQQ